MRTVLIYKSFSFEPTARPAVGSRPCKRTCSKRLARFCRSSSSFEAKPNPRGASRNRWSNPCASRGCAAWSFRANCTASSFPRPARSSVYELLAGAEASVGWIVWNNTLPCFWGRFLSPPARAEIFGDPDWLYASSTRPSGKAVVEDDGYRVSGRWSLVSGCELSEWMALRCMVEENGQPRMLQPGVPEARLVFLRRADVEILDTWHTGGLRGTGSHDVVVKAKVRGPRPHLLADGRQHSRRRHRSSCPSSATWPRATVHSC